jgi:hypothetical protein
MGEPSRRIDVSPVVAGILSDGPKFKRFNGWNGSNAGNQVPEIQRFERSAAIERLEQMF